MRTISATEAKNKFGHLMSSISAGSIAITKNGKIAAYLTPSQNNDKQPLTGKKLDKILNDYSLGNVTHRDLEELTGLWFSDILAELEYRELSLPKVDSKVHFNEKQLSLYNSIFS